MQFGSTMRKKEGKKLRITNYPKPSWRPKIVPSINYIIDCLHQYLVGKHYTLFENGTCVVWPDDVLLKDSDCINTLLSVVQYYPDFKVRNNHKGDVLVTFRGGVGGVMPGYLLHKHFYELKEEALIKGFFPSEVLRTENGEINNMDLIAGLYVRARLYLDVENPVIVVSM